jgi:hypothetical protein
MSLKSLICAAIALGLMVAVHTAEYYELVEGVTP